MFYTLLAAMLVSAIHLRRRICPDQVNVSNAPLELICRPNGRNIGSKVTSTNHLGVGGFGSNAGRVAVANRLVCGVIGAQSRELVSLCRFLIRKIGCTPLLVRRTAEEGAITVGMPNGKPGRDELYVQRMHPPRLRELARWRIRWALRYATSVFVGPMAVNGESRQFHAFIARTCKCAACMLHPSMFSDTSLLSFLGQCYTYVQCNREEAQVLEPGASLEELACKLRFLMGPQTWFSITNGDALGLAWIENQWIRIQPASADSAKCVTDRGCGDCFGEALWIALQHFGASPKAAVDYATCVSIAHLQGDKIPVYSPGHAE